MAAQNQPRTHTKPALDFTSTDGVSLVQALSQETLIKACTMVYSPRLRLRKHDRWEQLPLVALLEDGTQFHELLGGDGRERARALAKEGRVHLVRGLVGGEEGLLKAT